MIAFKFELVFVVCLVLSVAKVNTKAVSGYEASAISKAEHSLPLDEEPKRIELNESEVKQLFTIAKGKETSPPDFVRLVVMRLIYGIASSMGLEERLDGIFNGVFVPPNADSDLFGFGSYGGDEGGEELFEEFLDI